MKEKIRNQVYQAIADAFMMDVSEVEKNPGKRLREDMGASSMQYLPLISTLEDECDLEIDLHGFQNEARTINEAVEYVCREYEKQHQ
jgi:Acyl carrier protein